MVPHHCRPRHCVSARVGGGAGAVRGSGAAASELWLVDSGSPDLADGRHRRFSAFFPLTPAGVAGREEDGGGGGGGGDGGGG